MAVGSGDRSPITGALSLLLRVLGWGVLWAAAAGVWLFGPRLLREHHAGPTTAVDWALLAVAVLIVSGLVGSLCALLSGILVAGWQVVRRRPSRDAGWVLALATGALLPPVYLAVGTAVEWRNFNHVQSAKDYVSYVPAALAAYVAVCVVFRLAYRSIVGRRRVARPQVVAAALASIALAGSATLPLRTPVPARLGPTSTAPLVPRPAARAGAPPLLFIGLDGGNWETLDPLLAEGALPTFGRLVAEGIHGDMQAQWPPYWSATAWAAILTSHSPEENGVFGDMILQVPGLPDLTAPVGVDLLLDPFFLVEFKLADLDLIRVRHPPRSALHTTPVWELLSAAGVETAVLRFDFTYPADGQAAYVVSSWVGRDSWQVARSRPAGGAGIATAAARSAGLLAPYSDNEPRDARLFAELFPHADRPPPPDAVVNPVDVLRISTESDRRTLAAARRVLEVRPDLPVLAFYISGFDKVCHAFWQYRFPDDYGSARPAATDSTELGPVVDRYLGFLDRALGQLIAAYPQTPNVVLVSDHGFEASLTHPLWKGWHSGRGIMIAAGPSIAHRDAPLATSYYDVVPTVADLLGFAPPAGVRGASLLRR